MNDFEHNIRLSQAGHPQDQPETRYAWRWKLWYGWPIGFTILAVIGARAFA